MKLKTNILILLLLLIAFSTAIAAISFYLIGSDSVIKRIESQLQSVVILKENQLQNFIEDVTTSAIYLEQEGDFIREYLKINSYDGITKTGQEEKQLKEAVRAILDRRLKSDSDFTELFVLGLDGTVLVSTDPSQEKKIKADREYFLEGKKTVHIQLFYYSLSLQMPSMTVGIPIKSSEGNVIGVLAGRINLNEIGVIMNERSGLGKTGETVLVNKFHLLITESRFEKGLALTKTIFTDAVKDCLKGNSGFKSYKDYRNIDVIGAYSWIPNLEVCIVAKIDRTEAFMQLDQIRSVLMVTSIGTVILGVFLGLFLSSRISSSIKKLNDFAHDVSEGKLNMKIELKSNDDVNELGESFNKMASELRKSERKIIGYSRDMKKKVEERTKELESKNKELTKFNQLVVNRELKMIELKKKIQELEGKSGR